MDWPWLIFSISSSFNFIYVSNATRLSTTIIKRTDPNSSSWSWLGYILYNDKNTARMSWARPWARTMLAKLILSFKQAWTVIPDRAQRNKPILSLIPLVATIIVPRALWRGLLLEFPDISKRSRSSHHFSCVLSSTLQPTCLSTVVWNRWGRLL